jgi:hypothetical protein
MNIRMGVCALPARYFWGRHPGVWWRCSANNIANKHQFRAQKQKGLPKKAFQINYLFWLPDLDSNQGPAD